MQFQVILEHDPDTGHVTGTVAGIPEIIVDGLTEAEAIEMAKEAIAFWRDEQVTPWPTTLPHATLAAVEA